jgi:hypothetical protein
MRRQLVPASLAQPADALFSKSRFLSVRIRGDAPHKIVKAPMVESVDTAALKTVAIARSDRALGTTQFTTVSPSWWNGRHTCLRNRRTSIPSSNLGEGTIHHSRLAQRESGCFTRSGSAVQSRHRLPVFARWPSGPRRLPAKQLCAGSNPARASTLHFYAPVAQPEEHSPCKRAAARSNRRRRHHYSSIAHWVERSAVNREARGSEPRRGANYRRVVRAVEGA